MFLSEQDNEFSSLSSDTKFAISRRLLFDTIKGHGVFARVYGTPPVSSFVYDGQRFGCQSKINSRSAFSDAFKCHGERFTGQLKGLNTALICVAVPNQEKVTVVCKAFQARSRYGFHVRTILSACILTCLMLLQNM